MWFTSASTALQRVDLAVQVVQQSVIHRLQYLEVCLTQFECQTSAQLNDTICQVPYRESKVFRLIPWVGFGYAQRFKTTESYDRPRTESPTLNAGIFPTTNLRERLHIYYVA